MLQRPYEFLCKHPLLFSALGVGTNLLARQTTQYLKENALAYFPDWPKFIPAVKNVIDESFNQIFYQITFFYLLDAHKFIAGRIPHYQHILFTHKAMASVAAAFAIYATEIMLYKGFGLFSDPNTQDDIKNFLIRHSSGQHIKFAFLQGVTKTDTTTAIGGALLYGIRTAQDKFYFNDIRNFVEEFIKAVMHNVKQTPHYISTNDTSFLLSAETTQANIEQFTRFISTEKKTLSKIFADTNNFESVFLELSKHLKGEFAHPDFQPFLDNLLNTTYAHLPLVEQNHAISNHYFTLTDILIGVANNLAFSRYIPFTTPESTKLLIGALIRSAEAFAKFVRDETFSYLKAPYILKVEDAMGHFSTASTCPFFEQSAFSNQPISSAVLAISTHDKNLTCENHSLFEIYNSFNPNTMCPIDG